MKNAIVLFAALADPVVPKTLSEFGVSMLPLMFGLVSTVMTMLVFPALKAWLLAKAEVNKFAHAALKLESLAEAAHAHVAAGMQAELAKVSADGVITDAEKAECKAEALRLLKEFLGQNGLDTITGALGIGASIVDDFLTASLAKASAKAPEAAKASP